MGTSEQGDGTAAAWAEADDLPLAKVRELFVTLGKALRAFQLYDEHNPVYKRFVTSLGEAFQSLWEDVDGLQVSVEEDRFLLAGEEVYQSASRADSLSFLFYKDGVRTLTFLPGIELDELERLLGVLQKAKTITPEGDDLLTILWEQDLQYFQYQYVDLLAEGVALPEAQPEEDRADIGQVAQSEVGAEEEEEAEGASEDGEGQPPPQKIGREDFNPTLYALDPREKEQLKEELAAEMSRDLRGDVLAALFDRLAESDRRERQSEIVACLGDLLPNFLSRGAVEAAGDVLEELTTVEATAGVLDEVRQGEVVALLDKLSSPETIEELVRALDDGTIDVSAEVLGRLLGYLRSGALSVLLRASEESQDKQRQETLRKAVRGIAEANTTALLALFEDANPVVASGAARLAAEIHLTEAGPKLAVLMGHSDAAVRLAGVVAARILHASSVAGGLINALGDTERDVRIEAARALAGLKYTGAAGALKALVTGKDIKQADLTEKIAVFESYGALGGGEAADVLNRLLNRKGFLGRRESAEIRACAAMALGVIRTPKARKALETAKREEDAVVRTAVRKALQGAEGAE